MLRRSHQRHDRSGVRRTTMWRLARRIKKTHFDLSKWIIIIIIVTVIIIVITFFKYTGLHFPRDPRITLRAVTPACFDYMVCVFSYFRSDFTTKDKSRAFRCHVEETWPNTKSLSPAAFLRLTQKSSVMSAVSVCHIWTIHQCLFVHR